MKPAFPTRVYLLHLASKVLNHVTEKCSTPLSFKQASLKHISFLPLEPSTS